MDDEREVYIWNELPDEEDENEDPLRIDPLQQQAYQSSLLYTNSSASLNSQSVVKKEHVTDEDNFTEEVEEENFQEFEQELPTKLFMCKLCKQPYEMVCGSNLMIRGFCNNCLYSGSNKSRPCDSDDKTAENNCNFKITSLTCSFCSKDFTDKSKLNEHLNLRPTCQKCNDKFCSFIELEKHLLLHKRESVAGASNITNNVEDSEKLINPCQDIDIRKHKFNLISCDNTGDVSNEMISGKSFIKTKEEKCCIKLSPNTKKIKSDVIDYKIRCEMCCKLVIKSSIEEHVKTHTEIISSGTKLRRSKTVLSSLNEGSSYSLQTAANDSKHILLRSSSSSSSVPLESVSSVRSPELKKVKTETSLSFFKYEYFCDLCKTNYDNLHLLQDHLESDMHVNMIVIIVGINLSCKLCKGNFNDINDLKIHLMKEDHIMSYHIRIAEINFFTCKICDRSFLNESDYHTHQLLEGHRMNIVQDNVDKVVASGESIDIQTSKEKNIRKVTRSRKSLLDKTCKKSVQSEDTLISCAKSLKPEECKNRTTDEHIPVRRVSRNVSFICKVCKTVCSSSLDLRKHESSHRVQHNNAEVIGSAVSSFSNRNSVNKKSKIEAFVCNSCNKSFNNIISLKKHCTVLKHEFSSSIDLFANSLEKFDTDGDIKQYNLFKCSKCYAEFWDKGEFLYHICVTNHNIYYPAKVKCIACNKVFELVVHFIRHSKRKTHVNECLKSDFIKGSCELCNFNYENDQSFQKHITSDSHIGMFLKYSVTKRQNIKIPAVTEKQSKPAQKRKSSAESLPCKHCSKKFVSFPELYRHVRSHSIPKGQNKCQTCQKRFTKPSLLKKHIFETHSPKMHACDSCPRKFTYRYQLIIHTRKVHEHSTLTS